MHDLSYADADSSMTSSRVSDTSTATTNEALNQYSPAEKEAIIALCMLGFYSPTSPASDLTMQPLDLSKTGPYAKKC